MKATLVSSSGDRYDCGIETIAENDLSRLAQASGISSRWTFVLVHPEMSSEFVTGDRADLIASSDSGTSINNGGQIQFKPDTLVSVTAECTAVKTSSKGHWTVDAIIGSEIEALAEKFDDDLLAGSSDQVSGPVVYTNHG